MFDLFGNKAKRDLQGGYTKANESLTAGRDAFNDRITKGYGSARDRLSPYQKRFDRGGTLYDNALGINGADARQSAYNAFANDPFRDAARGNTQNMLGAMFKKYNAGGMGDSGASRLALSRANMESEASLVDNWLNRLQGYGQQGYGVASDLAGLDTGEAGLLGDNERSFWQGRAGNQLNQANAMAQQRGVGLNNLLNIAGTVARFIPGAGGGGGGRGGVGGMYG